MRNQVRTAQQGHEMYPLACDLCVSLGWDFFPHICVSGHLSVTGTSYHLIL